MRLTISLHCQLQTPITSGPKNGEQLNSCIIGGPITGLSETVQIEIYKHFQDPLEAKQLFTRMEPDYVPWNALMEWVNQGYPGTWHDWWEKHRPSP